MATSINTSFYDSYKAKLNQVRTGSYFVALNKVYGSGDYSGTDLSRNASSAHAYFGWLKQKYPILTTAFSHIDVYRPPPTPPPTASPQEQNTFLEFIRARDAHTVLVNETSTHISKVNAVRNYYQARKERVVLIREAMEYWRDWNRSIHDFIDRGVLEKNSQNLIGLPYNGRSDIKADTLREYFVLLNNYALYGPECKVKAAQAAENMKEEYANKAIASIDTILNACNVNIRAADSCIEGLTTEASQIDGVITSAGSIISHLGSLS